MCTLPQRLRPALFNSNKAIVQCCRKHGIAITAYASMVAGERMNDKILKHTAVKHNKSVVTVCLHGHATRIRSDTDEHKYQSYGRKFEAQRLVLDENDMEKLDSLDEHLVTDWDVTDAR